MHDFRRHLSFIAAAALLAGGLAAPAQAADWSDTSIGIRGGSKYAEPFNGKDITKTIVNLNHASGYKYGSNFFNADFLLSDKNDPAGKDSTNGAQEVYVVYRHTLDLEKSPVRPSSSARCVALALQPASISTPRPMLVTTRRNACSSQARR